MRVVDLPTNFHREVAANVRAEMARQRITQNDLIAATGWSQQKISRRLTGTVAFDVAELAVIADYLGKEPAELLPASSARAA
jgi:transcriptional regulator with XRE-family HTH domain